MYFRLFFDIVFAGLYAPFAALYLLLYQGRKLIFGDVGDDPLQPLHEGPSDQGVVPQLRFQLWADKMLEWTRSGKKDGCRISMTPVAVANSIKAAAVWNGFLYKCRNPSWDTT